jgi:replicative superfamily II helicase
VPQDKWSPQEHSERRNPASNQWEFYRDDTGYGQTKCTGDTQEIPRKQKYRFEKAQEEIKETIEALYKHQSETKNTVNKEINELRTKIDNIKEEESQDMENIRKKNKTDMQNKNGRPIQHTRTSKRQNLRTRRWNDN